MADRVLNLWSELVELPSSKAGRPTHKPSDRNRNKIIMLGAIGRNRAEIAKALGIDQKTMNKHYSEQLKKLAAARMIVEGELLVSLAEEAVGGNVAAADKLFKRFDRADLASGIAPARRQEQRSPKLGKKEETVVAAKAASESGEWGSLLKH